MKPWRVFRYSMLLVALLFVVDVAGQVQARDIVLSWEVIQNPYLREMILIPAGEFQMGCDPDHNGGFSCSTPDELDELPLHTVYLDAYEISKYEVTNEEYAAFLNARSSNDCAGTECLDLDDPDTRIIEQGGQFVVVDSYEDHPVIEVTWFGANSYCMESGGRLPTEAEWEKAARGTAGRAYPWGDGDPDCSLVNGRYWGGSFWEPCVGDTVSVGSYPAGASQFGALDMAGNVWEWVNDWYASDYYGSSPYANPPGPTFGMTKVERGGSWYNGDWRNLRVAVREDSVPSVSQSFTGFRCADDMALQVEAP